MNYKEIKSNWLIPICFLLVSVYPAIATRKIPDYIHICKRNDPEVDKCIKQSVEVLKPRLKSGIPELGVPPLEPLKIGDIEILRGDPTRTHFTASVNNVQVTGASDFTISKLKSNVEKGTYRVGVKFPLLHLSGDYDVDARILVVPIKGQGKFIANISNCDGQGVLHSEIIEKNGHREFRFKTMTLKIKIGDFNIHLDNLFNGDPNLSKAANEMLNNREFLEYSIPFVERKASEILLDTANKICDDIDYDEIFPAA